MNIVVLREVVILKKKFLSALLVITLLLSLIPAYIAAAATIDLTRAEVYTAEEGNIARLASVRQLTNTSETRYNPLTGDGIDRPGINASFCNDNYGVPSTQVLRVTDGRRPTSGSSNGYLAWSFTDHFGVNNRLYFVLNWDKPYIINAVRCDWWTDSNVSVPNSEAKIEWLDGTVWREVTNMRDSSGNDVTNLGTLGMGNWNGVTFDPVATSQLRLKLHRTGNVSSGIGLGEWEVFGESNLALSDLASIDANMFKNMVEDVTLPVSGPNGSTITWSNSTNSALTTDGAVTRPAVDSTNATGTITATAVHPEAGTYTKTFDFTVIREMPNAQVPVISEQPQAVVDITGENPSATLSVTANVDDGGELSYQWYKNTVNDNSSGTAIDGATDSTYEVPVNAAGTAYYYVIVTNTNEMADEPISTASSNVSAVTVTPGVVSVEINPVNNLNPVQYTTQGGPGSPTLRDHYRYRTENTFLRPGESVQYNAKVVAVGIDSNPVWSINGGVDGTSISSDGLLQVAETQPAGDITVTAVVGGISASATVTVRIVTDENGYDQSAKWSAEPFDLSDVTLDDNGLLGKNRDITFRYLLQGNREEMHLKQFYMTAGITEIPVEINGKAAGTAVSSLTEPVGWDGRGYATNRLYDRALSGHGTGHYLTALSQAYQVAPEESQRDAFLAKMQLMVSELGGIQDTNIEKGSYMYGFLSAYNEKQFDALEEDKHLTPTTGATNGRGAWAIYYTQHKVIQGLLDIYTTLKDTDDATAQRALEIASKMGDWTYLRLSRWTQAEREMMWNVYSAGEVGGIADPIEQLYFITGDELYRETATFFEHNNNWRGTGTAGKTTEDGFTTQAGNTTAGEWADDAFFAHFAKGLDGYWLNGKHANTIVPMIIAALREYEADTPLDSERINPVGYELVPEHYYNIAKNFFDTFYTSLQSPIGSYSGGGEIFANLGNPVTPSWSRTLSSEANESCTTVNFMLLATSLFNHEQRAEYMDYYEKALLNHIMPALDQNSSETQNRIDYLTTLSPSAQRSHDRYGDGACCNGTGMEAHTRYQEVVYYKTTDSNGLYVNLYMPATLNWAEKGFQIVQESDYLNEGKSKITVNGDGELDIMLRVPYWIENGFEVKVNGKVVIENAAKSSYVTLSRTWSSGDVIEISMPFSMRIERSPENTTGDVSVLFYGPYMMVQKDGPTTRPEISGLNLDNLDSSFTREEDTVNSHSFGSYNAFRLSYNGVNYDPFYTTGYSRAHYSASFTIPRNDDNVAVNYSVSGTGGAISTSSNNRNVEDGQEINRGSIVTFTATPDEGYVVKEWRVDGVKVDGNLSSTYRLTSIAKDTEVTVEFALDEGGTTFTLNDAGTVIDAETTINTDSTARVYMAMYDANQVLLDLEASEEFTGKATIKTSLNLPEDTTGITVKVFVWDNQFIPLRKQALYAIS